MADETKPDGADQIDEGDAAETGPLAEASFLMLVASLSAQAGHHLGMGPGEVEGKLDLPIAKYTIDLLNILADKTEGNLTEEEKGYLDSQLFGLRMRFVEASKGGG